MDGIYSVVDKWIILCLAPKCFAKRPATKFVFSFSVTAINPAYCEDSYGEETSSTDATSCQAAGNYWIEASCSYMEYTKQ